MKVTSLHGVEPFITIDGSEIREVAGIPTGNAVNQSLAEATVAPGTATEEHYHRSSEEIYFFTHGSGRLRVGDQEREVEPGDTVVIAPGTAPQAVEHGSRTAAPAVLLRSRVLPRGHRHHGVTQPGAAGRAGCLG